MKWLLALIGLFIVGLILFWQPQVALNVATKVSSLPEVPEDTLLGAKPLSSNSATKIETQDTNTSEAVSQVKNTNRFQKYNEFPLNTSADYWPCVLDRNLNVLWEVKTLDGGYQDHQHTYTWLKAESKYPGKKDGGQCIYVFCDTQSYLDYLNEIQLCGLSRWRLPNETELRSLDHPQNFHPDIDRAFFPNTQSSGYWSSEESQGNPKLALIVDFSNNIGYLVEKRLAHHVRAVADWQSTQ